MARKNIPIRKRVNLQDAAEAAKFQPPDEAGQQLGSEIPMPFIPGNVYRTARENRDLEALGIDPSKPLPGDFARRVQAAREAQAEEFNAAVDEASRSGKPLKMPKDVKLDELSDERKADLLQSVQQAEVLFAQVKKQQAEAAEMAQLRPSIRAAAMAAAPGIEIFDSGVKKRPEPQQTKEPPKFKKPEPEPEDKETQIEEEQPFATGAVGGQTHCPRCNHPVNQQIDIAPTREDLIGFEVSVASQDAVPFMKSVELFGGRLKIVFQTATRRIAQLAAGQYKKDQREGLFFSPEEGFIRLDDYLTILGIRQVIVGGDTIMVADSVEAELRDCANNPDDDAVRRIHETFADMAPFSNESAWRAIRAAWRQFDQLVQYMEANAPNRSFWPATVR